MWHCGQCMASLTQSVCSRALRICLIGLTIGLATDAHADEHQAHPYAPILRPIVSTPQAINLTKEESQTLDSNMPVVRQAKEEQAGSGIAVQDIDAPPEYVWRVILSHHMYAEWVKNIDKCHVYKKKGRLWYISMLTSFLWVKSQLYMIHRIQRPMGYISWTLDRSRTSDLKDVTGYWRISTIDDEPNRTRLEYGSQIVAGGVPDFVIDFLTRDSLLDGTSWVKQQAEAAWQKSQASSD